MASSDDLPFGPHHCLELLDQLNDGIYVVDRERRIRFWNRAAVQLTGYTREEVMDRTCGVQLLGHTDATGQCFCRGHCPIMEVMASGRPVRVQVFLRHKAGHRVAVDVHMSPLREPDGTISGCIEVFRDASPVVALEETLALVSKLALRDELTDLANRRHLDSMLDLNLGILNRTGTIFSVILADLDHFKLVNDRHGHVAGDQCLQLFARQLTRSVRSSDVAGRFGGEEFLVILPRKPATTAQHLAERIRHSLETTPLTSIPTHEPLTASFGVAEAKTGDDRISILARVDRGLYSAKNQGRNQVRVESTVEPPAAAITPPAGACDTAFPHIPPSAAAGAAAETAP